MVCSTSFQHLSNRWHRLQPVFRSGHRLLSFAVLIAWAAAAQNGGVLQDAAILLQRGDYSAAEAKLRSEVKLHPSNAEALSLLGASLDSQKRFAEAEAVHRKALALAPRTSSVIDKYGSHLSVSGQEESARQTFLKALSINPADAYANLQLAQLSIHQKDGDLALRYLGHLSASQAALPEVAILRFVALSLTGRTTDAETLLTQQAAATSTASLNSRAASALAAAGLFDRAEIYFSRALAADPGNFGLLYNLAISASQAGHPVRAREALEFALPRQPNNVELNRLLASVLSELKDYAAAVPAWDRYAALAPADDVARRERGYARVHIKQTAEGIADLRWYLNRHADDAVAWFELGVAESAADPTSGISSFDKAISLKPDFAAAHSSRGALYFRQGEAALAVPDLEIAASSEPNDPLILDRLGQAYRDLDRVPDALRFFRRAAALAPNDLSTQLHLANTLAQAGQTAESEILMERIRKLSAR